ncbi:MAG TPA: lysophospholipid acyltransferase family protein [Polyangiaceae bacterium]|jgi:1-acyl-sn-glycerol-3-phosphate acyltransferase|nr:lysophospholipid acyltransferase family protein [Polyangiaceae bacterium]
MRINQQVREAIDGLELPFNALGVDPYGVSKRHLRIALGLLAIVHRYYFSVRTSGIENIPPRGRAMLVGNHSGGIPIDAAMVITTCLLEMSPPRLAQGMVEKFLYRFPFLGQLASRTGQFPGLPENAERLLEDERLLLVFPEGARGTAKLFRQRYSLVDFGSGFLRLALKTHAPIVPFVVLGASEAFPTIANAYTLGRAFGVPYIPVPAYGLPVALPARIEVKYGAPLLFEGTGNENDEVVHGHVGKVKDVIAQMLVAGARRRRGDVDTPGSEA